MRLKRGFRTEIGLVESVAIERQPVQQWVEPTEDPVLSLAEARQRPASADRGQVQVLAGRAIQEVLQAVPSPRRDQVEQRERHRGTLECESTIRLWGPIKRPAETYKTFCVQSRIVPKDESSTDPFEPQARALIGGRETTTLETGLTQIEGHEAPEQAIEILAQKVILLLRAHGLGA